MTRLVLVCGSQRSGTTLVQTLVANMLASPVLPEAHIFCDMIDLFAEAEANWLKTAAFYRSKQDFHAQARGAFRSQFERLGELKGSPDHLVLKDPNFIRHVGRLETFLAEGEPVIAVVRDARDIAASFLQIGMRQAARGERTKYTKRDMAFVCAKINRSYEPILGDPPPFVRVVRYEDFVADPERELVAVAARAGLPSDGLRKAVDRPEWLEPEQRHKDTWITELEGGPASAANVRSHMRVLSAAEAAAVEELCAPYQERFGYA